ncbi:unnamed protein product [Meloidogyne enterolobii]
MAYNIYKICIHKNHYFKKQKSKKSTEKLCKKFKKVIEKEHEFEYISQEVADFMGTGLRCSLLWERGWSISCPLGMRTIPNRAGLISHFAFRIFHFS